MEKDESLRLSHAAFMAELLAAANKQVKPQNIFNKETLNGPLPPNKNQFIPECTNSAHNDDIYHCCYHFYDARVLHF